MRAYKTMTNSQLGYEIEFLIYENGRIARGHAEQVAQALEEAVAEMKSRGFDSWRKMVK